MITVPTNLDDFIYNKKIAKKLKIYSEEYLENLIFYGQNNSGKRTLITALLNNLSNNSIVRNMHTYKLKINNNKIDINFIESKYHFEINLYEYGHYDKNIISEFLKYILSYKSINTFSYKIIVIHHFDKVSKLAQLSLRRTIEKCYNTGRFILCCENINKIDQALLSRCIHIRVPKPKLTEIENYIKIVLTRNAKSFDKKLINSIIEYSNKCIYKVNLILQNYIKIGTIDNNIIQELDIIKPILNEIEKKNFDSLKTIRNILYKYLLLNFTPAMIFLLISNHYENYFKGEKKNQFIHISADLNSFINKTKHDIFILEAFIINIKYLLV